MSTYPDPTPDSELFRFPSIPGYELDALLGRGGMGRVYRARDRKLGRLVAIKCLVDSGDPQLLRRFEREAKAASRLQHPNIAQLYEFQSQSEPAFLVMELVQGGTLAEYIDKRPLEGKLAASIVSTIAGAIGYAHQNDIVHRDLKPSNILIGRRANATKDLDVSKLRVADFGLAKTISEDSNLTRTGEVVGTANYMSPEQATGVFSRIGPSTDIYSMGAILYELLTGRPPFVAPDSVQTLMMMLSEEPVAPKALVANVPLDLQTICLKCLEKKSARRYASAIELSEDLDRFCRNEPIHARPISHLHRSWKWARRRPWQAVAIGLVCFSAIGSTMGLLLIQQAQHATQKANLELIQANTSLTKANKETEVALDLTQDTLASIVNRVRDELVDIPKAIELRHQTAQDSVALNRELLELRPKNYNTMQELARALEFYRLSLWNSGDREESHVAFVELKQHLDVCCVLFPEDVFFGTERIKLALESVRSLEPAEQVKADAEIQSQIDQILELHPDDPWVYRVASIVSNHWMENAIALGDLEAVGRYTKERVEYCRKYVQFSGDNSKADASKWLIGALTFQSNVQMKLKDFESMQLTIDEAQSTMDSVDWKKTDQLFLSTSARLHELRGNLAQGSNNEPIAIEQYKKGIDILRGLDSEFPDEPSTQTSLAQLEFQLAIVLYRSELFEESKAYLLQAESTVKPVLSKLPDDYLANHIQQQIGKFRDSVDGK